MKFNHLRARNRRDGCEPPPAPRQGARHRLRRRQGRPQLIELDHNALFLSLRNERFHSSILTLEVDGKKQVLLRDVQLHPYKPQVQHVDFQRVDETRRST